MGRPPRTQNTRKLILDAAIDVVSSHRSSTFSLDEVAARAGISKGGLLYNYPSKNDLIAAMVAHFIEDLKAYVARAEAEVAEDGLPNKLIRAHLIGLRTKFSQGHKPNFGILAAIGEQPEMLDPIRVYTEDIYARIIAESENPKLASMVYFATEGLRCIQIFRVLDFSQEQIISHLDCMLKLLETNELPTEPA